jgi:hypothetical protein
MAHIRGNWCGRSCGRSDARSSVRNESLGGHGDWRIEVRSGTWSELARHPDIGMSPD